MIVPLASVNVLSRLRVPMALADEYLRDKDAKFFYCIARDATMRMETSGVRACSSTTAKILRRDRLLVVRFRTWFDMDLWHRKRGCTFGRALRWEGRAIYFCARIAKGKMVSEIRVGGSTVPVAKGRFFLA